jgi:hypothetical protein
MGVWGMLMARFLAQLSYNNWRWPQLGLRELDMSFFSLIYRSFGHLRIVANNSELQTRCKT